MHPSNQYSPPSVSAFYISKIGCWIRKQTAYRRSIASEVWPVIPVQIRYSHQLHKTTIVKEEKNRIPSLSCKHRAKIRRFLANHFCKWLPVEPGRRLPAPSHCTGFTCSKHATLALKPFGAKLLGCDCRGLNCYHSIRVLLWRRLGTQTDFRRLKISSRVFATGAIF